MSLPHMSSTGHAAPVSVLQDAAGAHDAEGAWLFFRRWLANPLQMGSVIPSSSALCQRVAANTAWSDGEAVVELGAGTGVMSRALLSAGLPASRLFVVEIVPRMAAHLAATLPGANVITGDAFSAASLIPPAWHGRIGTVICGIPMVLLRLEQQRRLVAAIDAMAPGRGFLHFSYCVTAPLPYRQLGLTARQVAWTPRNFPPASVWRFTPTGA